MDVRWRSSALPQKQLEQEEEEVGGRKVRRWRLNGLQEERWEHYSSISLLLSEIKEGLRINWVPQLSRSPQRLNPSHSAAGRRQSLSRVSDRCRDLNQQPSTQPTAPFIKAQSSWRDVFTLFCFNCLLSRGSQLLFCQHIRHLKLHWIRRKIWPTC